MTGNGDSHTKPVQKGKRSMVLGYSTARSAAAAIILSAGLAAASPAISADATQISEKNRTQIEQIVREYLLKNPEILVEMQSVLEKRQDEAQKELQRQTISSEASEIFRADYDGIVGNPDGKVTIVEFFDYNCGFCKRALSDMNAMVENDKDLRFVLKEFPILGEDSHKAHIVAQAFRALAPEKYGEFHRKLLGTKGHVDEDRAISLALSMGVDEAALREEMKNPEIEQRFRTTYRLANDLAITGTPSYVIADEVIFGALGRDVLTQKVANVRSCQSATC